MQMITFWENDIPVPVYFSSVQDGIYALGKAHVRSTCIKARLPVAKNMSNLHRNLEYDKKTHTTLLFQCDFFLWENVGLKLNLHKS